MRAQRLEEVNRLVQGALPGEQVAVRPASVCEAAGVTYAVAATDLQDLLVVLGTDGAARGFEPVRTARAGGQVLALCRLTRGNAQAVRAALPFTAPQPLGKMDATVGLGDRLGCAGPGHIAAIRRYRAWPVLAQQSVRELTLTGRTFPEVLDASTWAVLATGFREPWGADGDHLKTEDQVRTALSAGLTMITADVSERLRREAATMSGAEIDSAYGALDAAYRRDVERRYLYSPFPLVSGGAIRFTDAELRRVVILYRDALELAGRLYRAATDLKGEDAGFDFELSVDETDTPTKPLEHLFWALELKRRGVKHVVSLAPRFIGDFEKGIDYKGDLKEFEKQLRVHAAIAEKFGPYKISVHSGSDKFSIYPVVGRVCGTRLHLKTAGTSYLEALRVVVRVDKQLFGEIAAFDAGRFAQDKQSYHISATDAGVAALAKTAPADFERVYLNETTGRQLLHVTFGSTLTIGKSANGRLFKESILEILNKHKDLHTEVLSKHLGEHMRLLNLG